MKLPLNATTIPNLDKALAALPREALQKFADRVFTFLYLDNEKEGGPLQVCPDKEWDQSAIEEVDSALREILDPRGGTLPRKPRATFQERADRFGYTTLGHLLDMAVESGRVTKKEASIAMKAWESEEHHSPDYAWDNTAGPCLDRIARIVKQIAASPNETPKL